MGFITIDGTQIILVFFFSFTIYYSFITNFFWGIHMIGVNEGNRYFSTLFCVPLGVIGLTFGGVGAIIAVETTSTIALIMGIALGTIGTLGCILTLLASFNSPEGAIDSLKFWGLLARDLISRTIEKVTKVFFCCRCAQKIA
jgi:hypothetical protein